jgi:hypothetical protein
LSISKFDAVQILTSAAGNLIRPVERPLMELAGRQGVVGRAIAHVNRLPDRSAR